jgi:hypothetical protein
VKLQSLKMIDSSFIMEIEHGIQAFESYLISEYGKFASFPYLFFERAGLVYQLRVREEGSMQELWCVRDDQAG